MVRKPLPEEALVALRQRFEQRSTTRAERKQLVQETSALYGVSAATVYRALRTRARSLRRTDAGVPASCPQPSSSATANSSLRSRCGRAITKAATSRRPRRSGS